MPKICSDYHSLFCMEFNDCVHAKLNLYPYAEVPRIRSLKAADRLFSAAHFSAIKRRICTKSGL